MGGVLRKPVAVNSWESLTAEAQRLLESSVVLLRHGGSQQQMISVMAQAKMIARMCQATLREHPLDRLTQQRAEWLQEWYSRIQQNYDAFRALRRDGQYLARVDELEERLLD